MSTTLDADEQPDTRTTPAISTAALRQQGAWLLSPIENSRFSTQTPSPDRCIGENNGSPKAELGLPPTQRSLSSLAYNRWSCQLPSMQRYWRAKPSRLKPVFSSSRTEAMLAGMQAASIRCSLSVPNAKGITALTAAVICPARA